MGEVTKSPQQICLLLSILVPRDIPKYSPSTHVNTATEAARRCDASVHIFLDKSAHDKVMVFSKCLATFPSSGTSWVTGAALSTLYSSKYWVFKISIQH